MSVKVYFLQSREPSFHSWSSPKIRIIRNPKNGKVNNTLAEEGRIRGEGRRRTISISKTKNRTANRKNRREKGSRAEDLGSNPHSNGEDFSRSK